MGKVNKKEVKEGLINEVTADVQNTGPRVESLDSWPHWTKYNPYTPTTQIWLE
jgi:hypothetical protein